MTARLATVATDLVSLIDRASDEQRRTVAIAAGEFAMSHSGLNDQRLGDLLAVVRAGTTGDSPERSAVEALASSLDEAQWDLEDRAAAGEDSAEPERWVVFGRARAAMAVFFAASEPPRHAALESVYEASAVVDDLDELRAVVVPLLS